MALIDEIKIYIKAGKGGDGVVRWRHEKGKPLCGPSGGNGGRGGDVYAEAVSDIGLLGSYSGLKEFKAEDGQAGMKDSCHGKAGEDFTVKVPQGSILTNLKTGEKHFLNVKGERVMLLKGGRGGVGNEFFKSSTNTSPEEFTVGERGEEGEFLIELEMFADVGLVGLPNAGKSSLLNAITNAHAKVGNYAFTTLEPNLGALFEFIIADIPGLIEGASEGKGLGIKFLKHIKRTKMLVHLISAENDNMTETYQTVRNEVLSFDDEMKDKKEYVVVSKSDVVDEEVLKKKVLELQKIVGEVHMLSILDDASVKSFIDGLVKELRK